MTRIVHLLGKPTYGGAASLACARVDVLRSHFDATEHRLLVLGRAHKEVKHRIGEIADATVLHRGGIQSLHTTWELRAKIRDLKCDLLHTYLAPAELWGALAMMGTDVPVVRDLITESPSWLRTSKGRAREALVRRLTTLDIAVSDTVRDRYAALDPAYTSRTTVVYPPLSFGAITAANSSRRRDRTPEEPYLLITARLVPSKGVDVALEALAMLHSQCPSIGLTLKIAGTGPDEKRLIRMARELGLTDDVTFLGYVQDIWELHRSALALLSPTSSEGLLGYAAVEALALKTPLIISSIPSVRELLRDGEHCLMVRPRDPKDLAARICDLINDPAAAERRVRRGNEMLRDVFDPADRAADLEQTYLTVLNQAA